MIQGVNVCQAVKAGPSPSGWNASFLPGHRAAGRGCRRAPRLHRQGRRCRWCRRCRQRRTNQKNCLPRLCSEPAAPPARSRLRTLHPGVSAAGSRRAAWRSSAVHGGGQAPLARGAAGALGAREAGGRADASPRSRADHPFIGRGAPSSPGKVSWALAALPERARLRAPRQGASLAPRCRVPSPLSPRRRRRCGWCALGSPPWSGHPDVLPPEPPGPWNREGAHGGGVRLLSAERESPEKEVVLM